jgi:hypothetical protein
MARADERRLPVQLPACGERGAIDPNDGADTDGDAAVRCDVSDVRALTLRK